MALVAVRDIPAGSEVLCEYGYSRNTYQALNFSVSAQECSKVIIIIGQTRILISHCREDVTMSERLE